MDTYCTIIISAHHISTQCQPDFYRHIICSNYTSEYLSFHFGFDQLTFLKQLEGVFLWIYFLLFKCAIYSYLTHFNKIVNLLMIKNCCWIKKKLFWFIIICTKISSRCTKLTLPISIQHFGAYIVDTNVRSVLFLWKVSTLVHHYRHESIINLINLQ